MISSLVVFGNVAEVCDLKEQCGTRLIVIILVGVVSTFVAAIVSICSLLQMRRVRSVETGMATLLVVLYSVCVGVVSSIRTGLGTKIAVSFAWFSEVLAIVAVFGSFTGEGESEKIGMEGMQVPEAEYMERVGEIPRAVTELDVVEPMRALQAIGSSDLKIAEI